MALFTSNDVEINEAFHVLDSTYVFIQKNSDYNFKQKVLCTLQSTQESSIYRTDDSNWDWWLHAYHRCNFNNDAKKVQRMFKINI